MAEKIFKERFCEIQKIKVCTTSADLNFDKYTDTGTYEIYEDMGNEQSRVYFLTVDKSASGACTKQTRVYCGKIETRHSSTTGVWSAWTPIPGGESGGSSGTGLAIDYDNQLVAGTYNKPVDAPFIIGNGTSDAKRNNAFTVNRDGSVEINGIKLTQEHLIYMLQLGSIISGRKIDLGQRNTITSDKAYNYFSIGWDNIISGRGSFSTGYGNVDAGEVNFTFGTGNNLGTKHRNAAVFGRYNNPDDDFLFAVGCGTSDADRKNALTIDKYGGIQVGSSGITIGNTILSEETLNRLIEKL